LSFTDSAGLEDVTLLWEKLESIVLLQEQQDISFLTQPPKFHKLSLNLSANCDLTPLGAFEDLQELYLWGYGKMGKLQSWANLGKLRRLSFQFQGGSLDLRALSNLKMLECLSVGFLDSVSGLEILTEFSRLVELTFSTHAPKENIPPLGSLKTLQRMVLWNCPGQKDLSIFEGLDNLEFLSIGYWPDLEDISILNRLPRLRSVLFGDCPNLSPAAIEQLKTAIPDCSVEELRKEVGFYCPGLPEGIPF